MLLIIRTSCVPNYTGTLILLLCFVRDSNLSLHPLQLLYPVVLLLLIYKYNFLFKINCACVFVSGGGGGGVGRERKRVKGRQNGCYFLLAYVAIVLLMSKHLFVMCIV